MFLQDSLSVHTFDSWHSNHRVKGISRRVFSNVSLQLLTINASLKSFSSPCLRVQGKKFPYFPTKASMKNSCTWREKKPSSASFFLAIAFALLLFLSVIVLLLLLDPETRVMFLLLLFLLPPPPHPVSRAGFDD